MRLDPTTSVLCHGSSSQLRRRSACERGVERPRRSKGGERNTEIGGRDKGQGEQWWKTGAVEDFAVKVRRTGMLWWGLVSAV